MTLRKLACGTILALAVTTTVSAQTLDKKVLSLEAATKIAAAASAAAKAHGVGVVIAIVDDGGHLILLHRLDDAQVASETWASARDRKSTRSELQSRYV